MMRMPSGAADSLTIGQLAEHTGVSAKTIRYYESIGLLPWPPQGRIAIAAMAQPM